MELFIQIKNGQPFEHPILGDNFRQAFPNINTNNLPEWVARFVRGPAPAIGVYEIYEGLTYEKRGEVYTDVHHIRQMSNEEKLSKQEDVKTEWGKTGFASWVFNEKTCVFYPPISYPEDDKIYRWDEPTISWVEVI